MHRDAMLLIAAVLALAAPSEGVQGQEDARQLGVTLDYTYHSKWMTKGKEGYGQQGGLFETIDFDFWGTGLGAAVTHQSATASGYVNKERLNYKLYYGKSLFVGKPYQTDSKLVWTYKHYPNLPRNVKNMQEWELTVSWPKLLPCKLVPRYIANFEYPAGSEYENHNITGWLHRFGLGYKLKLPQLPEPLSFWADVAYTDGQGGTAIDHDWSYATFSVATTLKLKKNLSFVPTLYHQISMDDSICKRDVTYCTLGLKYKF